MQSLEGRREPASERVCGPRRRDPCARRLEPLFRAGQLTGQQVERRARGLGHIPSRLEQPIEVVGALRYDDPGLGKVRADRVHGLGPLAHDEVPRLVVEQRRPPHCRLHRHDARSAPLTDPVDGSARLRGSAETGPRLGR